MSKIKDTEIAELKAEIAELKAKPAKPAYTLNRAITLESATELAMQSDYGKKYGHVRACTDANVNYAMVALNQLDKADTMHIVSLLTAKYSD